MFSGLDHSIYKVSHFIIISLLVIGCASHRNAHEIIERTEMPVYKGEVGEEPLDLQVMFHILEDGQVKEVQILTPSGDPEWDKAAADSLRKWRFAEPPSDTSSVWVQRNIKVQFLPSQVMNLGELTASSRQDANILYSRLRAGVGFEQLFQQISDNPSNGVSARYLREANTINFPTHVSKELISLNVEQFTRPIQVNGNYVIYKRFADKKPE